MVAGLSRIGIENLSDGILAAAGTPWFAILCWVAFYVLISLEMLLPTGGMAGLAAAAALIASAVVAWEYGPLWSAGILGVTTVTMPPLFGAMVRLWPRTKLGQRILNVRDDEPVAAMPTPTTRDGRPLAELIGLRGVAVSDLMPDGLVRIEGHRVNAISEAAVIDRGQTVEVVGMSDRQLWVRRVADDAVAKIASAGEELIEPTANSVAGEPTDAKADPLGLGTDKSQRESLLTMKKTTGHSDKAISNPTSAPTETSTDHMNPAALEWDLDAMIVDEEKESP